MHTKIKSNWKLLIILTFIVGLNFLATACTTAQQTRPTATVTALTKQSQQNTLWMFSSEASLTQVANAGQNALGLVTFKNHQLSEQPNDSWQNGHAKTPDWGSNIAPKYVHQETFQRANKVKVNFPNGSVLFGNGFRVLTTISGRNNGGFHYQGFKVELLNQQGQVLKSKGSPVTVILIYKVA